MSDFRSVTPDFAVAGQLSPADLAAAAAAGFRTLVNNRPDGEAPGQMSDQEARAAAEAAGLSYFSLPFAGAPPEPAIAALAQILAEAEGPVLAFCRTGTRSITAWAMAEAKSRHRQADEIIALAHEAGYDLSRARGALAELGGG
jgi:sulfide:quinone oxidoreductase